MHHWTDLKKLANKKQRASFPAAAMIPKFFEPLFGSTLQTAPWAVLTASYLVDQTASHPCKKYTCDTSFIASSLAEKTKSNGIFEKDFNLCDF